MDTVSQTGILGKDFVCIYTQIEDFKSILKWTGSQWRAYKMRVVPCSYLRQLLRNFAAAF